MKKMMMIAGVAALSLMVTGCATKKYVAKTIAPVEAKVAATEAKNTEQDTKLAANAKDIEDVNRDLSRTKERLTDTDTKATAAGASAQQAGQRADAAQTAANNARTFAETGVNQANQRTTTLARGVDATLNLKMTKSAVVLFDLGKAKITDEGKAVLDEFAKQISGDRYVVEIQGFTDKTGTAARNDELSQQRAEAVARYLTVQGKVPVRNIDRLGSGYANPVADDKTRDGRKQNRRVEVRLFTPEAASAVRALGN